VLKISKQISIPIKEIHIKAIRSRGAGGQNVNKVSTAVHLRFNIKSSSLPDFCKERLLLLSDQRITSQGVIVIKAQDYRSQMKNREAALSRLKEIIRSALSKQKKRKPTKPTVNSQMKRLIRKIKRGRIKALRRKVKG
jgi:ribosome-associated protein